MRGPSLMAMVPLSECNTPTLMGSCAMAPVPISPANRTSESPRVQAVRFTACHLCVRAQPAVCKLVTMFSLVA